jgi:tetratricopeptide (TPR) repeat protein
MKTILVKKVVDGEIVEVDEEIEDDADADAAIAAAAAAAAAATDTDADADDDDDVDDDDVTDVEPWMADEGEQKPSDVPVSTHIRMKQKLKGRLTDKDEEMERLRKENEALKSGVTTQVAPTLKELPKRPKENDFDTILEYDEAMTEFDENMLQIRLDTTNKKTELKNAQIRARADLDKAVDAHYERAAKLIQDNNIDTEVYKKADLIVREAIEGSRPNMGDIIADQIIAIMGEGSEKVLYFLGRNKNALDKFKSLLESDPSGLRASLFLGQQKERLLNIKRKTSKATPPNDDIKGDVTPASNKGKAFLKRRKAAVKKGDIQAAYDAKKEAKAAGIDVSTW